MKARHTSIRYIILCIAGVCSLLCLNYKTSQMQKMELTAEEYARQLWSPDESVRIWAKNNLIQLGPKAAKPLIAFLQDYKNNPQPRFIPGKEKEGAQILEDIVNDPSEQRLHEALNRLGDIDITGRLLRDTCEILGAIHSTEAVPILVYLAEREGLDQATDRNIPSLQALINIGSPAVPNLIQSIKNTEDWIFSLKAAPKPDPRIERDMRSANIQLSRRVQMRMIIALREIGDNRALPILEDLLTKDSDQFFIRSITEAIRKIKEKSSK